MPEIKQHDWSKLTPSIPSVKQTHGTMDFDIKTLIDKHKNSKNGDIIVTRKAKHLHPFKCSKCEYIAPGKKEFKEHWEIEH